MQPAVSLPGPAKSRSTRASSIAATLLLTLSAVTTVACGDAPPTVSGWGGPDDAPPIRTVQAPTDDGINYGDTWSAATYTVAETTVVTSDTPFFDPATRQYTTSVTVAEAPQQVPSLAGYGHDGKLRVTAQFAAENELETARVRHVGDATSDVNRAGEASGALPQEPSWELGTLTDAQIVQSGSGSDGGFCEGPVRNCGPTQTSVVGAASVGRPVVVQMDANRVRVTEQFVERLARAGAAHGGGDSEERTIRQERMYERKGVDWVLRQMRTEGVQEHARGRVRHVQSVTVSDFRHSRNAAADALRLARRLQRERTGEVALPSLTEQPCSMMRTIDPCVDPGADTTTARPPSGSGGYPAVRR